MEIKSDKELVDQLGIKYPQFSSRKVFTNSQIAFILFTILSFITVGVFYPSNTFWTWFYIVNIFYFLALCFKVVINIAGGFTSLKKAKLTNKSDDELPVYSVLLPMYDEAAAFPRIVDHFETMNYPKNKLQVMILLELSDDVTRQSIKDNCPILPDYFEIIDIPDIYPRTKPKSCNYAMNFVKGDYVCVYDAEDLPDVDQLKKAIYKFDSLSDDYIGLQSKLYFNNGKDNLLAGLFSLEYMGWYDYWIPGMCSLGISPPLGGTSNHFKTDKLKELGCWDGYNVTEDCDLGIRIRRFGYKTDFLNSTTVEEACDHLPSWIKQRTRWTKGYMITYLVHNRNPLKTLKELGLYNFIMFNLFIGGTIFCNLINPILYMITSYFIFTGNMTWTFTDDFFHNMCLFNLIFGNIFFIISYALGGFRRKEFGLSILALFAPFYWLLHSFSTYRAVLQIITNPHKWEKTHHKMNNN